LNGISPAGPAHSKKCEAGDEEMRSHYDFTGGVRGRYARRYAEGTNVVALDPDVARLFPNREAVNDTPRAILDQKKTRVHRLKTAFVPIVSNVPIVEARRSS